jgi:hypothetical protein
MVCVFACACAFVCEAWSGRRAPPLAGQSAPEPAVCVCMCVCVCVCVRARVHGRVPGSSLLPLLTCTLSRAILCASAEWKCALLPASSLSLTRAAICSAVVAYLLRQASTCVLGRLFCVCVCVCVCE